MIEFNQAEQRFTTGVNGASVPLANVFTVNASDLATANQLSFNLLSNANVNTTLVVVNVVGAVNGRFNLTNAVINLNGLPAANIIWNVCDAAAIGLTNLQFRGSLLAPFSDLNLGYVPNYRRACACACACVRCCDHTHSPPPVRTQQRAIRGFDRGGGPRWLQLRADPGGLLRLLLSLVIRTPPHNLLLLLFLLHHHHLSSIVSPYYLPQPARLINRSAELGVQACVHTYNNTSIQHFSTSHPRLHRVHHCHRLHRQ
jgi:hypothetical protein